MDGDRRVHHGQNGQLRDLTGRQSTCRLPGPTLLGFDVIWIATLLSAVATLAVLTAIYAATTVKDPMATPRQGAQRAPRAAEGRHRRLDQQAQEADQPQRGGRPRPLDPDAASRCFRTTSSRRPRSKLMQAGIRTKDLAFFIIFARFILPLVLGSLAVVADLCARLFTPNGRGWRRYMTVAGILVGSLQGARHLAQEQGHQAQQGGPQGPSRRARPAGHLRRGRPDRRRRLRPRRQGTGQGLSGARRRVRPDRDRAGLPQRAPPGVREPRQPRRSRSRPRRRHDHDPDREIRYSAGRPRCACCRPNSATSG